MNLAMPTDLTFQSGGSLALVLVVGTICIVILLVIIKMFFNPKKTKIGDFISIDSTPTNEKSSTKKHEFSDEEIENFTETIKKLSFQSGLNYPELDNRLEKQEAKIRQKLASLKTFFLEKFKTVVRSDKEHLLLYFNNFLTRYFDVILINLFVSLFKRDDVETATSQDLLDITKNYINLGVQEFNNHIINYYNSTSGVASAESVKKILAPAAPPSKNELVEQYKATFFNIILFIKREKEFNTKAKADTDKKLRDGLKLQLDVLLKRIPQGMTNGEKTKSRRDQTGK